MKDAIRYIVTVEAVIERVEKAGQEWAKTSAAPNAKYDYTPEIEKTVQKKIECYKQEVDYLDMQKLVSVINGIQTPQNMIPTGSGLPKRSLDGV